MKFPRKSATFTGTSGWASGRVLKRTLFSESPWTKSFLPIGWDRLATYLLLTRYVRACIALAMSHVMRHSPPTNPKEPPPALKNGRHFRNLHALKTRGVYSTRYLLLTSYSYACIALAIAWQQGLGKIRSFVGFALACFSHAVQCLKKELIHI